MAGKRLILSLLLGIIVIGAFCGAVYAGIALYAEQGWSGLISSEMLGLPLRQKYLADFSVLVLTPFVFSGMLLAVYRLSTTWALRLVNIASVLVAIVGGLLNVLFLLAITISLILS